MDIFHAYPHAPSEEVILGTAEGRNLSPVRRFFCLLVTFDLLFTVLLWILCIILVSIINNSFYNFTLISLCKNYNSLLYDMQIRGSDQILQYLIIEVTQYTLDMSIFDIVVSKMAEYILKINYKDLCT